MKKKTQFTIGDKDIRTQTSFLNVITAICYCVLKIATIGLELIAEIIFWGLSENDFQV